MPDSTQTTATLLLAPQHFELGPLTSCLEERGHRTVCVSSAQEGLEVLTKSAPPLVLLGEPQGDSSWADLLASLRLKPAPQPYTVFISNTGDTGAQRQALEAGVDELLLIDMSREAILLRLKIIESQLAARVEADLLSHRCHELETELSRQSTHDMLTGCFNRRHILELAERELSRGQRYNRPFSALFLDLDNFKALNQRHGYGAGDEALKRVVAVCKKNLRRCDAIGRTGGDDFLILLPETSAHQALTVAGRILAGVKHPPVVYRDQSVDLSVSIGAAQSEEGDRGIDALLLRATQALSTENTP
ncbi:MAG: GGDEF domain-containing protein [Planctomycetota bacterium]